MTLKNVELIEQQAHEQSWFQKFRSKFGSKVATSAVVTTGVMAATGAHADIPDFLAEPIAGLTGIGTNLGALFLIAIGITLMIVIFTNSRGGLKRAG